MRVAVDASAVLAVLLSEPDAEVYLAKLVGASKLWISPITWWEVQVRLQSRYGAAGVEKASAWMDALGLIVEPVTLAQSQIAMDIFGRFRGRPARLNLGDCFAYALAVSKDAALLYKGNDFEHTGIPAA